MLARLMLIFLIPTFLLYTTPIPQNISQQPPSSNLDIPIDPYDEPDITFDKLFYLIENAENPRVASRLSPQTLDKLTHLMTILAKEGTLPGQEQLKNQIDNDIEELNSDTPFAFATAHTQSSQYTIDTSQDYQLLYCGWFSKKWKKTCRFVRKHKKAIIIGAAAVAAVAIIVATAGSSAAALPAAGAAATAANSPSPQATQPAPQPSKEKLQQISSDFKSELAKTNPELIAPALEPDIENIRDYSSVITHQLAAQNSEHFTRIQHLSDTPIKIDNTFGTDLAQDLLLPPPDIHPDALPHHIVGQKALEYSNYSQALQAFDKALKIDPDSASTYLDRSYTNALLGKTTDALEDLQHYKDRAPTSFTSGCMVAYHFTKGLKTGAFESGKQLLHFAGDIVTHPIHTTQQVYDALAHLTKLAYTQQWTELGTALAPEVKQLIEEWNNLPDTIRGERAGYILGKYGADILIPGATAKIISKGTKAAKQVVIIGRNLKNAERLLALETGITLNGTRLTRTANQLQMLSCAEKLGFTSTEVTQLLVTNNIKTSFQFQSVQGYGKTITFTNHALKRSLERNIAKKAIFEALESPLEIKPIKLDKLGRPSQRFIGKNAEVVLNPETHQIVSVNPTSTKKAKKLQNEICNVNGQAK